MPAPPSGVLFPKNQEEVQAILKLCNQYGMPVVPHGGGTSLEGHISAYKGGITISFENVQIFFFTCSFSYKKLNKLIAVNEKDMDCVVQPGITYDELNEQLAKYNLFFPVDPGPGNE